MQFFKPEFRACHFMNINIIVDYKTMTHPERSVVITAQCFNDLRVAKAKEH